MSDKETCLVVDDEPAIRRVISLVLRDLSVKSVEAPDAESALEVLDGYNPTLMIVDVALPGMDGVEFLNSAKRQGKNGVPTILISAYREPPWHPADIFLPKPFDIEDLSDAVSDILRELRD